MPATGCEVMLEVLRTEGVTHIFGNPGTTELPLLDALASAEDIHYVLALQEATAVGMADGYAQATGRPAILNLHALGGLGNAVGSLTNAQVNGTPLIVTAGQQDQRHLVTEPLLSGDLVGLASPVSKWTYEVRSPGELGTVLRRAFHDAASPPTGPVFVSIPVDVLTARVPGELDEVVPAPSTLDRRPIAGALGELAELLVATPPERLAIVAGDEVAATGAVDALVTLAEALGVRVYGSTLHANTVFPTAHPLWGGSLGLGAAAVRGTLSAFNRVLAIGSRVFMAYTHAPGPAVPSAVELLHLSRDPHQLGRTWPVRLGLVGDPRATLEALLPRVAALADSGAAASRLAHARAERDAAAASEDADALSRYGEVPMAPVAAVHALLRAMPPDTIVVDEAMTSDVHLRAFHRVSRPGRYFFCRGGGLGWGVPAALGVSLGCEREAVACLVGDGSALYCPQALWTAAHEQLPVLIAVLNNRQYLMLKENLRQGRDHPPDRFVGMDIDRPPVDFVALASSMGVEASRVGKEIDVADAARAALEAQRPYLLELPVSAPA